MTSSSSSLSSEFNPAEGILQHSDISYFTLVFYLIFFTLSILMLLITVRHFLQIRREYKRNNSQSLLKYQSRYNSSLSILSMSLMCVVFLSLRLLKSIIDIVMQSRNHSSWTSSTILNQWISISNGISSISFAVLLAIYSTVLLQWWLIIKSQFSFEVPLKLLLKISVITGVNLIFCIPHFILSLVRLASHDTATAESIMFAIGSGIPCLVCLITTIIFGITMVRAQRNASQVPNNKNNTDANIRFVVIFATSFSVFLILRIIATTSIFFVDIIGYSTVVLLISVIPDFLWCSFYFGLLLKSCKTSIPCKNYYYNNDTTSISKSNSNSNSKPSLDHSHSKTPVVINDYEVNQNGNVILYFERFEKNELRYVDLEFVAQHIGTYRAPASSAWLYYQGDRKTFEKGVQVQVK
eukprot:gb/GECH01004758.1/.p1 GENE.gb/GECH01004758.1/~~gb/GECH01004758.1/.p1  ORF type:complete len:410 (+),score=55.69 gb/GECH01004758.1/:1-1230(+)